MCIRDREGAAGEAHRRTRRSSIHVRRPSRAQVALLPLLGLIPSFLLATYALTQPWARGRALLLVGISRSPGAALLLAMTLLAMVGMSVAVATRTRRRDVAAGVHVGTAVLMAVVALAAFRMIRHAGVKILFVPIATVHPGRGLRLFVLAAGLVLALGLVEFLLPLADRRSPGGSAAPEA
ncbi:MAG: hypothetical protein QUU85_05565 [Candidatus Eisenbacteria bacterium]|nr:hypothetical protein [Candidatus Eisenbacteria bacterium]